MKNTRLGAALIAGMCWAPAFGQTAQTLTLLNPYPATGAVDIAGTVVMSRALRAMQNQVTPSTTDALIEHLRHSLAAGLAVPVAVERNSREGGAAAARLLPRRKAVLFSGSGLAAGAALDALDRLEPLALVARIPVVLVVRADEAAGIRQLMAKTQPMPLQIGVAGERSAGIRVLTGMQPAYRQGLVAVAYNGGNGALRGLLSGQVPAVLVPLPATLPYAVGGRVRILAIASPARHPVLRQVPTFYEAGVHGVIAAGWHGLFSSPEMPAVEGMQLRRALAKTLSAESLRETVSALGYEPGFQDAAALGALLAGEMRNVMPVLADLSVPTLPAASPH
ncbi:MAG: hypothetical protein KF771_05305 [Burkholderiales bacterium]|nr:hypothetical protein [Burkholderiales bacterium]